jgi:hypothetical protein
LAIQKFQACAERAAVLRDAPSHAGFMIQAAALAHLPAHYHSGAGLEQGHQRQTASAADDVYQVGDHPARVARAVFHFDVNQRRSGWFSLRSPALCFDRSFHYHLYRIYHSLLKWAVGID